MDFLSFLVRHWWAIITSLGIGLSIYGNLGYQSVRDIFASFGIPLWASLLVSILFLAGNIIYLAIKYTNKEVKKVKDEQEKEVAKLKDEIERIEEEVKKTPRPSVLQTRDTYSQMKEDAENAKELFLTSFLSGHSEGQQKETRIDYFGYIEDVIENHAKPITRIEVFQNESQKINRIERLIEIGQKNPKFELRAIYQWNDFPYNLQIFYPVSAYIFDPVFAQDSSKDRARHIRLTDLSMIEELKGRYEKTLNSAKTIKGPGANFNRLNYLELQNHAKRNEVRDFLQNPSPLVYDVELKTEHDVANNLEKKSSELTHRSDFLTVESLNWNDLNERISGEDALISYGVQDLISRCNEIRSAVAIDGPEIVCHVSARTLLDAEIGAELTGLKHHGLGDALRISEVQTGFTRKDARRHKVFTELRAKLLRNLEKGDAPNDLVLSFCNGIAASPVLDKLGWRRFGWTKYPFVSSLVGWFDDDYFYKVGVGIIQDAGREPWNGKHMKYSDETKHYFENYISIWSSDKSPDERWLKDANDNLKYKISSHLIVNNNCDPNPSEEECLEWWRGAITKYFRDQSDVADESF